MVQGKPFSLSNLKIKRGKSGISGSFDYLTQSEHSDFLLIVYFSAEEYLLFTYYTNNVRQVFVTPKGRSGDVALSSEGYKIKPSGNKGSMEFYLPYKIYGVYDLSNLKGNIYVFYLEFPE